MTFEEFKEKYEREKRLSDERMEKLLEKWDKQDREVRSPEVVTLPGEHFDDAEFLLEQLLLASSLLTVAMHHLKYYATVKGKDRKLDEHDQHIMENSAGEIEAFLNLLEGEGIGADTHEAAILTV